MTATPQNILQRARDVSRGLDTAERAFTALARDHRNAVALIRSVTKQPDWSEDELDMLILEAQVILERMREVAKPYIDAAREAEGI